MFIKETNEELEDELESPFSRNHNKLVLPESKTEEHENQVESKVSDICGILYNL